MLGRYLGDVLGPYIGDGPGDPPEDASIAALLDDLVKDQDETWTPLEDELLRRENQRGSIVKLERHRDALVTATPEAQDLVELNAQLTRAYAPLLKSIPLNVSSPEWKSSYLRNCFVMATDHTLVDVMTGLAASPHAELLKDLSVAFSANGPDIDFSRVASTRLARSLRRLTLSSIDPTGALIDPRIVETFDNLRELTLNVTFPTGPLRSSTITRLKVRATAESLSQLRRVLLTATFEQLHKLEIELPADLGQLGEALSRDAIQRVAVGSFAKNLRVLRIQELTSQASFPIIEALFFAGDLWTQLDELDLGGTVRDPPTLQRLTRLVLPEFYTPPWARV